MFLTFATAKLTTMRAATWPATVTHPHSCAQPRAQLLEACAWHGFGSCSGSQNRNLNIRVLLTLAPAKLTTMRAATWAAAAAHPRSCAQPRAQLLEACAWHGFGTFSTAQNRNLKIRVFLTLAKSKVTAMRAATLAATATHPHSCAQPRAQLLEAFSRHGIGTVSGSQNRNLKIRVSLTFARAKLTTMRAATWHAAATHPRSCAQPRAQLLEACARHGFGTFQVPKIGT